MLKAQGGRSAGLLPLPLLVWLLPLVWFLVARFGHLGYFEPFTVKGETMWPVRQWAALVVLGVPWLLACLRYARRQD